MRRGHDLRGHRHAAGAGTTVVTGAVGAATLLAAGPLAEQVGTPTLLRVVGAVLVVVAIDIGAALMVAVAVVTAGFGITHLRLARQLRR